ncbi:P-loop containing nucleoside triphosphate hydrolase protein [Cladorrhinum sp. PSN259]|nr:P-loop containing nucleoside triphosphate hydrolase protein [Cladorrhinum sp. PSN259]
MTTLRLAATVLATPPTLRRAVIHQTAIRSTTTAAALLEEDELPSPPKPKPPPQDIPPPPKHRKTSSLPAIIPTSYLPPPSNDPNQRAVPAVSLSPEALYHATHIFSSHAPKFLYSAGRFLELPRNPHTPEVCLIGRSNVGKSTLINALSGLAGSTARNSHGLKARQANSAITSRKAGCTVTLNGYGFGEPPAQPRQQIQPKKSEEEKEKNSGMTRTERRQAQKDQSRRDPPQQHALIMVDMPGYGHNSERAWGKEIQKYLEKRVMLRGAIVLIDSVSGVKPLDRQVLHNLRNAGLKTAVVLTKVDKLIEGKNKEKAQQRVQQVCLSVWKELRAVERRSDTWAEGAEAGWEREIFVTGAGDPKNAGLGVDGARWAICKMAGLVEDTREIVGFDEIKWAPAKPLEVKEDKKVAGEERITTFEGMEKATAQTSKKRGDRRLKASF